jgi:hypothetical protein
VPESVAIRPIAIWEDQPAVVKAVSGRSVHTLKRWEREGLTKHTRGRGTGARDFWFVDEIEAFLRATSRTNHDSAADSGDDNEGEDS